MKNLYTIALLLFLTIAAKAQVKILFDATKAETAGNADWIIDADLNNLYWANTGPEVNTGGTESNAQRIPTPAQSGITGSTTQEYWTGALSAWAVDLAKRGYIVETLPYSGQITYNNGSNAQDLSHYKVFVIDEPNVRFTTAEKAAIIAFVQNGGGLFMISDHPVSDRNNDGWDSYNIWTDFLNEYNNPFGMMFDSANFSQTTFNVPNLPGDSLLHGPYGDVTQMKYSNGTSMTLNPQKNSSVKGVIYQTGAQFGNTGALVAYARYGTGKVVGLGDSSPTDDGTGDVNDQLYDGWLSDASGNHEKLIINATIWLAAQESFLSTSGDVSVCAGGQVTLTASGADSYVWQPGNFTGASITISPLSSGDYIVSGTKNNLTKADTIHVTVNPLPAVGLNIGVDTVCSNSSMFALTGGTPAGGIYGGTAVIGGQFDPSAGTGAQTVTYTYQDANHCSASASDVVFVATCAGIDEVNDEHFAIYPNPSNGFYTITSTSGNIESLLVYDATGAQVLSIKANTEKLIADLSHSAPGIYFAQISTLQGTTVKKLVKW